VMSWISTRPMAPTWVKFVVCTHNPKLQVAAENKPVT
jgi:hypothetical protein